MLMFVYVQTDTLTPVSLVEAPDALPLPPALLHGPAQGGLGPDGGGLHLLLCMWGVAYVCVRERDDDVCWGEGFVVCAR